MIDSPQNPWRHSRHRVCGIKRTGLDVLAVVCRVSAVLESGDHGQPQASRLSGAFLFPIWQEQPPK